MQIYAQLLLKEKESQYNLSNYACYTNLLVLEKTVMVQDWSL